MALHSNQSPVHSEAEGRAHTWTLHLQAEMSEDEGHSEDDSEGEDGDGDDHDALLVSPAPHGARPIVHVAEAVVEAVEHQMLAGLAFEKILNAHERSWKRTALALLPCRRT